MNKKMLGYSCFVVAAVTGALAIQNIFYFAQRDPARSSEVASPDRTTATAGNDQPTQILFKPPFHANHLKRFCDDIKRRIERDHNERVSCVVTIRNFATGEITNLRADHADYHRPDSDENPDCTFSSFKPLSFHALIADQPEGMISDRCRNGLGSKPWKPCGMIANVDLQMYATCTTFPRLANAKSDSTADTQSDPNHPGRKSRFHDWFFNAQGSKSKTSESQETTAERPIDRSQKSNPKSSAVNKTAHENQAPAQGEANLAQRSGSLTPIKKIQAPGSKTEKNSSARSSESNAKTTAGTSGSSDSSASGNLSALTTKKAATGKPVDPATSQSSTAAEAQKDAKPNPIQKVTSSPSASSQQPSSASKPSTGSTNLTGAPPASPSTNVPATPSVNVRKSSAAGSANSSVGGTTVLPSSSAPTTLITSGGGASLAPSTANGNPAQPPNEAANEKKIESQNQAAESAPGNTSAQSSAAKTPPVPAVASSRSELARQVPKASPKPLSTGAPPDLRTMPDAGCRIVKPVSESINVTEFDQNGIKGLCKKIAEYTSKYPTYNPSCSFVPEGGSAWLSYKSAYLDQYDNNLCRVTDQRGARFILKKAVALENSEDGTLPELAECQMLRHGKSGCRSALIEGYQLHCDVACDVPFRQIFPAPNAAPENNGDFPPLRMKNVPAS